MLPQKTTQRRLGGTMKWKYSTLGNREESVEVICASHKDAAWLASKSGSFTYPSPLLSGMYVWELSKTIYILRSGLTCMQSP